MTITLESARIPDWEGKDYLIVTVNPSYLASVSTALATAAVLREILGDVRFLILAPDSTKKPTLLGAPCSLHTLRASDSITWIGGRCRSHGPIDDAYSH